MTEFHAIADLPRDLHFLKAITKPPAEYSIAMTKFTACIGLIIGRVRNDVVIFGWLHCSVP